MQADLAYAFGWPPSELDAMEVGELLAWHAQIDRINRQLNEQQQAPTR